MSTDELRINGERLADHTYRIIAPLRRWPVFDTDMPAARHLRAWVNREHDERPTRDELREWVRLVLDDRAALAERPTVAEFDTLRDNYERQTRGITKLIGDRDGALREVRVLATQLAKLIGERDQARRELEAERIAHEATNAECNELVRELRAARKVATSDLDM